MGWPSTPLVALVNAGYRRCRLLALVVLTTLGALETASGSLAFGVGENEDPKASASAGDPVPCGSTAAESHAADHASAIVDAMSAALARRGIATDGVMAGRARPPLGYIATGPPV